MVVQHRTQSATNCHARLATHRIVDAVHVDARHKLDARRLLRVVFAALQRQVVDAAVVRAVAGADDGGVPLVHLHTHAWK